MPATAVVVAPFTLKDVSLIFGDPLVDGKEHRTAVSSVTFTPSSSTITWTGLGLNTYTDVATATWACTLEYAQDWDTPDSLSAFLFNNEGLVIDVTFKPKQAGVPSFTAEVIITPGAVGGPVNAVAVSSVTLGLAAKPVLVTALADDPAVREGKPAERLAA